MNKILLTVLIVGTVAVSGYVYFGGEDNKIVSERTSQTNENTANQPSGKKMAFAEFIKQGGSYRCMVRQSVNNIDSNGTVYINGSMIRGMFTTKVSGKESISNILMRGDHMYVWSPDMPVAMKMTVPKNEVEANMDTGMVGTYGWNAEQIGDYNCEAWNTDQATFAVPSGIEFTDTTQMGAMYTR